MTIFETTSVVGNNDSCRAAGSGPSLATVSECRATPQSGCLLELAPETAIGVFSAPFISLDPENRSDVDDVRALLLLHLRQDGSDSAQNSLDVIVNLQIPFLYLAKMDWRSA